jgi:hypothetical protein
MATTRPPHIGATHNDLGAQITDHKLTSTSVTTYLNGTEMSPMRTDTSAGHSSL